MATGLRVSDNIRIAVVGCGRISKNHFDAIARVEGLTLVGVADSIAERARAAGVANDVPAFESLRSPAPKCSPPKERSHPTRVGWDLVQLPAYESAGGGNLPNIQRRQLSTF